jgi:DNA-directed RNA polymerase subunit F
MIGKKTVKDKPVILAEVKEILSSQREAGELLYEQGIALDHSSKFSRLKLEDAKKLAEELVEAGIREDLAVKLTDILPQSVQEIRMLFSKERFTSDDEELKKVVAILQKYGEN